jgi:hypothetical protein
VAALNLVFTADGGETKLKATIAKDASTFAAEGEVDVVYDSGSITNTPALTVSVEVEQ